MYQQGDHLAVWIVNVQYTVVVNSELSEATTHLSCWNTGAGRQAGR